MMAFEPVIPFLYTRNKSFLVVILLFFFTASPLYADDYDFWDGTLYYNMVNGDEIHVEVIKRPSGSYSGNIIIPASFVTVKYLGMGYTSKTTRYVDGINHQSFAGCSKLSSIVISEGIQYIEEDAFYSCTGLSTISIPASITNIEGNVFRGCTGIMKVEVDSGDTVYDSRNDCNAIIETASNKLIAGFPCSTIPSGVLSIGNKAFYNCSELDSITIPEGVLEIGDYAFANCRKLKTVYIPSSVKSIGESAFDGCDSLQSIVVDSNNSVYDSRNQCNAIIETSTNTLIKGCVNTIIPSDILKISQNAFKNCIIESITVGPYIQTIEKQNFKQKPTKVIWLTNTPPAGYTNLEGVINYVANDSYSQLNNKTVYSFLSSIFTVDGVKYVPISPSERTCAAIDCGYDSSSTTININPTVKYRNIDMSVIGINSYTFYGNTFIQEVNLNFNGDIGERAFENCDNIRMVQLSNSGAIKTYAFSNCHKILKLEVRNRGDIDSYAFSNCDSITSLIIENEGSIGDFAFENSDKMTTLIIKGGVTSIGDEVFRNCSNLLNVKLNNNGSIGERVFSGCSSITTVQIGDSVTSIGTSSYKDCTSLNTIRLGKKISSIGNNAFSGCTSLQEITIPDSVTYLGISAFENCSSIHSVKIGISIRTIRENAFLNCTSLDTLVIGNSVKLLGNKSFGNCSELKELIIPYSVSNISNNAFVGCNKVKTVVICDYESNSFDSGLTLGSNGSFPLFSDCPLDSVYIGRNISYKTSSDYGYSPFYRNTSLRSVVITDNETEISDNEFYGCTNLKNVSIGNEVVSIGDWAFSGCSSLDIFDFGKKVSSIGKEAFSDCSSMTKIISHAKTPPTLGAQALDDINKWDCTLFVPEGSLLAYQAADQWKDFFFIEDNVVFVKYKLTYYVDNVEYASFDVEPGDTLYKVQTPVKEGYTFSGWSDIPNTMPAKDVVITGSFSINSYKLTYKVDDVEYKTYTIEYGGTINAAPEPSKEGYTFSGWSEIPATMPANDVIVTGFFSINSYKLTYVVDDVEYKTYSIEYGSAITAEQAPTKEGYTFSGWSDIPQTMPAKDVTITGTFSVNTYTLTYMLDGVAYKTVTVKYGTEITPETDPTKEGYTFSGWVGLPQTMPAQDITVTGSFSQNTYKLIYKVDGEVYKQYFIGYGSTITAESAPTKEGYTFSGWSEIPATMPANDVTVIGFFDINSYKLTYIVDGVEYKTYSIEYGSTIIAEQAPTKEGYTFSGWSDIPSTMPSNDVRVTGTFSVNSYTLTYMLDGVVYKTLTVKYGTEITPEADPIKEGYTFSDWSEIPATMPAGDVVVTGSFVVNKYLLQVLVDGVEVYSTSIAFGTKLVDYVALITSQGIDLSQWEFYDQIDIITMPAHDVIINAVRDGIMPVMIDKDNWIIYDLAGKKIDAGDLSTLPDGIYIINGRKYQISH